MKRSHDCILESTSKNLTATIEDGRKSKRHEDDDEMKQHAHQFEMKICQSCTGVCVIRKVSPNNSKGNAGKCYYTCTNKTCDYLIYYILYFEPSNDFSIFVRLPYRLVRLGERMARIRRIVGALRSYYFLSSTIFKVITTPMYLWTKM